MLVVTTIHVRITIATGSLCNLSLSHIRSKTKFCHYSCDICNGYTNISVLYSRIEKNEKKKKRICSISAAVITQSEKKKMMGFLNLRIDTSYFLHEKD